jgi:hypothetical protein
MDKIGGKKKIFMLKNKSSILVFLIVYNLDKKLLRGLVRDKNYRFCPGLYYLFCLVPQPIFKSKNLFNQLFFIKSNAPFIYLFFLSNLVLATVHKPFKYVSLYYLVEKKLRNWILSFKIVSFSLLLLILAIGWIWRWT